LCGPPFPPTSASSTCTKGPIGSLSERTIAARSLCSQVQAVSYEPKPMMRCRSLPEMPVRRVEISKIARNHILSGLLVFSSTVPEVRLVWWPHSAHSNVVPSRIVHTRLLSQRAQAGLPPQRALIQ